MTWPSLSGSTENTMDVIKDGDTKHRASLRLSHTTVTHLMDRDGASIAVQYKCIFRA